MLCALALCFSDFVVGLATEISPNNFLRNIACLINFLMGYALLTTPKMPGKEKIVPFSYVKFDNR